MNFIIWSGEGSVAESVSPEQGDIWQQCESGSHGGAAWSQSIPSNGSQYFTLMPRPKKCGIYYLRNSQSSGHSHHQPAV